MGAVLPEPAAACGYRAGPAVFAGIGDAGATTLASGIREPGQYNINLGTSGWVATVSGAPLTTDAGVFNLAATTADRVSALAEAIAAVSPGTDFVPELEVYTEALEGSFLIL